MTLLPFILSMALGTMGAAGQSGGLLGVAMPEGVEGRAESAFNAVDGESAVDTASAGVSARESGDRLLKGRRDELRSSRNRLAALVQEREEISARLDALDGRIEVLKSMRRRSSNQTEELENLLKESQALSEKLADKRSEEQTAGRLVAQNKDRMASALDREIGRLHANWEIADVQVKRSVFVPRLRALHQERRALRDDVQTGFARPPSPDGRMDQVPSDDPDALLEMADAFLDREDRLRREADAVERRIEQLAREQELERRLASLMEEESLFDESERRISLSRMVHDPVSSPSAASATAPGDTSDIGISNGPGMQDGFAAAPLDTSGRQSASASGSQVVPAFSAPAGRSNVEDLSSDRSSAFPDGNWAGSNSMKALKEHREWLLKRASMFHDKAAAASQKAQDMI